MPESSSKTFEQFLFGKEINSTQALSVDEMRILLAKAEKLRDTGPLPNSRQILVVLEQVSRAWSDPSYPYRQQAYDVLVKNSRLGQAMIAFLLNEFPKLFSPERINQAVTGEFGDQSIQDGFVLRAESGYRLTVRPAGLVLHVVPGNTFIGSIDSLINGMITKNVNFLKMSDVDRVIPVLFAKTIRDFDKENVLVPRLAVLWWQGGDQNIENVFKQSMDRIVFFGGPEALSSWKKNLGSRPILVQHGPKVSFGIISRAGLKQSDLSELTNRVALDITIFEQKACNCPQTIFVEGLSETGEGKRFVDALAESLQNLTRQFAVPERTNDDYVEILKARELALAETLITGKQNTVIQPDSRDWTIIVKYSDNHQLVQSALNRTIIIQPYNSISELINLLAGNAFYLQTVGYCLAEPEITEYANFLATVGVTRICPFGEMVLPQSGTPHDGSYSLRDLSRFTVLE